MEKLYFDDIVFCFDSRSFDVLNDEVLHKFLNNIQGVIFLLIAKVPNSKQNSLF